MKQDLWLAVHKVFHSLEGLRSQLTEEQTDDGAAELAPPGEPPLDKLLAIRKDLRTHLLQMKVTFSEHLSERDVYLALFPIVVYLDEAIQTEVFQVAEQKWPLLQKELFDVENGGTMFFDTLDDVLRQPETLPFILEVFYFCLSSGFDGRYSDNPIRIDSYKQMLRNRIPQPEIPPMEPEAERPLLLDQAKSPAWYYVAAAAVIGTAYLALRYWGGSL